MKKLTLLEIAKATPFNRKYKTNFSDEEIEVALAWIKKDINTTQLATALMGHPTNSASSLGYKLSIIIREAYNRGKIKIN